MSIQRHGKSKIRREDGLACPARRQAGFTLIELLVVVAIIAMLISILLPALSNARKQACAVACAGLMNGIGNTMHIYFNENSDFIPGLNTSGVANLAQIGNVDGLHKQGVPVQPHDWLTPLMRYDTDDLGDTRAKRFQMVINRYSCCTQRGTNSPIFRPPPDMQHFRDLQGNWQALSYLMPVHYQYVGQNQAGRILGYNENIPTLAIRARAAPSNWEVRTEDYIPRLDRVGQTARKIMFSDATRYLTDVRLLDHDVNPWPSTFGSFTTAGGWWGGATAFGVQRGSSNWNGTTVSVGSPSNGANLVLTYRHGQGGSTAFSRTAQANNGKINAMFFDGHVARLGDRQSREIEFWYPKGSKVQSPREGMTDVPNGFVIP